MSRWDEDWSFDQTDTLVLRLARSHLVGFSSPLAKRIRMHLADRDYRALISIEVKYDDVGPEEAAAVRQALAFFQKRSDLPLSIDTKEVAHAKFLESENLCRETNQILRQVRAGAFSFSPRVSAVIHTAARKIAQVLGPVPSLETLDLRYGPGSTTTLPKRKASAPMKVRDRLSCSTELEPIVLNVLAECPEWTLQWADLEGKVPVDVVPGRLEFVPKDAKTDRAIVVEPVLNSMFQLGIDDYMRRRLKAWGVDLSDQSVNQRAARQGSITGELATLDLSSASDTIALELVYELLPLDWAHFLSRFRTGSVEYKGDLIRLQKFSSMGNGFTFPLETLIFWALAKACTEYEGESGFVNAYGDDIILPSSAYPLMTEALRSLGFIPNAKKSFASGPFRESCGKDYYLGLDIRPFYLKGPLSSQRIFSLHNFYVRRGDLERAQSLLPFIPKAHILWGPDGYGDGHLVGITTMTQKPRHLENGWGGWTFKTWKSKQTTVCLRTDTSVSAYPSYHSSRKSRGGSIWVHKTRTVKTPFGPICQRWLTLVDSDPVAYDGDRLVSVTSGSGGYAKASIYTF